MATKKKKGASSNGKTPDSKPVDAGSTPAAPATPVEKKETVAAPVVPAETKPEATTPAEKKKFDRAENLRKYNAGIKDGTITRPKPYSKVKERQAKEAKAAAKLAAGADVTHTNEKVRKTTSAVTDEKILGLESLEEKPDKNELKMNINPMYLYIGLSALGIVGVGFAVAAMTKKAKAPEIKVVAAAPKQEEKPKTVPFDAGGGLIIQIPVRE